MQNSFLQCKGVVGAKVLLSGLLHLKYNNTLSSRCTIWEIISWSYSSSNCAKEFESLLLMHHSKRLNLRSYCLNLNKKIFFLYLFNVTKCSVRSTLTLEISITFFITFQRLNDSFCIIHWYKCLKSFNSLFDLIIHLIKSVKTLIHSRNKQVTVYMRESLNYLLKRFVQKC